MNNLARFLDAQNATTIDFETNQEMTIFESAKKELESGAKRTHWMWFIFPQIKGLGHSDFATKYGIANINEATDYFNHSVLGTRLEELFRIVNNIEGKTAEEIFGHIDAMKFHSCLTLFHEVAPENQLINDVLSKYYNGELDNKTLKILNEQKA